jgi:alpha-1,6-mannosyltransferase
MIKPLKVDPALGLLSLLFLTLVAWLGYGTQRADFDKVLGIYSLQFACYIGVLWRLQRLPLQQKNEHVRWLIYWGVLLRIALLWGLPTLSDDYYRFLWDGQLWCHGTHPFLNTPDQVVQQGLLPAATQDALYAALNSKRWHTVYPPVCQLLFAASAWLFPKSVLGAVFFLKIFLLCCEIGTLWLLKRLATLIWPEGRSGPSISVLYALNPLFIVEITGNCHFEGGMIFFMLLAIYALAREKTAWAAAAWGLATAAKLLPLLFVPLLFAWLGFRRGFRFLSAYLLVNALLFVPLLRLDVLRNMFQSIDLYFQKFEFNASLYYLCREIGFWQTGWNIGARIGPMLALSVVAGVGTMSLRLLWTAWRKRYDLSLQDLFTYLFWASFLHLICSTTVHPWYVLISAIFSLFSAQPLRLTGLAWTFLAVFSYSHYKDDVFLEKYSWIAAEYTLLGLAFFLSSAVSGLKPRRG